MIKSVPAGSRFSAPPPARGRWFPLPEPGSAKGDRSDEDAFVEQGELIGDRDIVMIGQRGWVIAGEAGVAMGRSRGIAARLAQRAVETIDRYERQTVGADILGHLLHRHPRREQFGAFGR